MEPGPGVSAARVSCESVERSYHLHEPAAAGAKIQLKLMIKAQVAATWNKCYRREKSATNSIHHKKLYTVTDHPLSNISIAN